MIWFWRYTMKARRPLSAVAASQVREGALIRAGGGVADVHPWPELGDLALDEQLARLARAETTPLTAASLRFAAIDAAARAAGASAFEGVEIPASHWPAGAGDVPDGFDTVKVKMSRGQTIDPALRRYRLRLDYNAALTAEEFAAERLPRDSIEFVEDPCPYDRERWLALRRATGVRLAADRATGDLDGADVIVVKPAVQEVPATAKEIVVTSYMDHPIGQLGAAFVAAQSATSARCGLLTHALFENDPFVERLGLDGMVLVPPAGTGFGFDDLLESLPWKRLA